MMVVSLPHGNVTLMIREHLFNVCCKGAYMHMCMCAEVNLKFHSSGIFHFFVVFVFVFEMAHYISLAGLELSV